MRRILGALALLLLSAMPSPAANYCVTGATPAGGCGTTVATIALAIAGASDGDTIYLHAGTTYIGHWTLTDKNMSTGIVITSDTATSNLPPSGTRITPAYSAFLPKLQSDGNTDAVFFAPSGSDHWTLRALWFTNNPRGEGDVLSFGSNACDNPGYCQEFESNEPSFLTADRILMTNSAVIGQKRGISFGGKNLVLKDSYLTGFAAIGQDSQCFAGANGRGPVLIDNVYCDAAGEDFMFGGDDPRERTVMTVTGSPTTTGASVSVAVGGVSGATHNLSELAVGQKIAILTGSNTQRRYTRILTITGSGTTGSITYEPIPEVPDVPGDIRTGAIANGVTINRSHFTKQLAWQAPIISAPASAVATASVAAGSLAAGTYSYSIVALSKTGYAGATVYSSPITASATLTATGQVVLAWQASPNATFYRVYGRSSSVSTYFEVASTVLTYTDTGSAGTAATSVPSGSKWSIKNLGELKAAINVLITNSVFEQQWLGSDSFPALAFKSTNQGGSCEWCEVSNVVLKDTIIRHVAGAVAITGQESEDPVTGTRLAKNFPPPATNISLKNLLIYDSNSTYLLQNAGTSGSAHAAFNIQNHTVGLSIEHVTAIHTMRGLVDLSCANLNKPLECQNDGFVFRNNLGLKNSFGIWGDTIGEGTPALTAFASSPYTVTANVIAGASASKYPAGNFVPAVAAFQAEFVNYSATGADTQAGPADFHLLSTSTYITAASDGTPIGADIDVVLAATNGVTSGAAGTSSAPTITTTTLPHGTNGTAYGGTSGVQLTGSGTGTLTWTKPSGTLPTGISLSSAGVLSGTPTVTGTSSFTVRATDATTSLTADQALSIVVDQSFVAVSISTGGTLSAGAVATLYAATITALNGTAPYTWTLASGSLPPGLTFDTSSTAITSTLSGTPTAVGDYSFSLSVVGALGSAATKAFTLHVALESVPRSLAYNGIFQFGTFRGVTCPTDSSVAKGDFCSDVSGNKAVPKFAESVSPIVWKAIAGSDNSHMVLSDTHTDVIPETVVAGDILVVDENLKWHRVPKGPDGTVLGVAGGSVGYVPQATSTTTTTVRPVLLTFSTNIASSTSWGATIGAGPTEFAGLSRGRLSFDFSSFKECLLEARPVTVGDAGTIMYVQYSADGAVTWRALDGGTGPSVPIDTTVAALNIGSYVPIESGAKNGQILMRIVAAGGSSSATPTFGTIAMQCR